jgi:hypothetical protein
MCQSVSATRSAAGVNVAAIAGGNSMPLCGRLTSNGALPRCRLKSLMAMPP